MGEKRGEKKGEKRGAKRGEKRGEKKGRKEVAKNMLDDGLSIEKVAQYTKLPRGEIEALL
jgi:predicted transposase/invertase (TIGR01784 family)